MPEPIQKMGSLPQHGRIRTGVKSGNAMKAIDTFRFTSTDKTALLQLATLYGGEVKNWHDPKANPPNQFELISDSAVIEVAVQPDAVFAAYELWAGGGLQRQCDGEVCTVWDYSRDQQTKSEMPCACDANGVLECKPKTRLQLIFPSLNFAGTWRYESSGLNAAHTLPSMMVLIETLQAHAGGLMLVELHLVDQERTKGRQKRKWKQVEVRTRVSVDQMLAGSAAYAPQLSAAGETPVAIDKGMQQLTPPEDLHRTIEDDFAYDPQGLDDDDVVDAEIVEEDETATDGVLDRATAIQMAKDSGGKLTVSKVDGGYRVQ